MIKEYIFDLMEKQIINLQDVEPEKLDQLSETMTAAVNLTTELIKTSPEFREAMTNMIVTYLKEK